ncbi:MAG TPA: guanylate kinase [Burkholderiales bacterium]|jgi:guanylate kinase|nr:guanylate kinase [Burkholderiales bacterium]
MSGNLFIVCAPSGAGKTTLVDALLKADSGIRLSVSYTTREPRAGEVDGREYHFVSQEKFQEMAAAGAFLESALVHGNYYGTSQPWINDQRAAGADILLEIDWQGAAQVRKMMPDAIGIFILPPSFEALVSRLNKRAQDPPDVIARRIAGAREEISHVSEFKYVIINDKFDEAVKDLVSIVRARRLLATSQLARHSDLINRMT